MRRFGGSVGRWHHKYVLAARRVGFGSRGSVGRWHHQCVLTAWRVAS